MSHKKYRTARPITDKAKEKAQPNKVGATTYGIVGLGRFGRALALELAASGAE